MKCHRCGAPSNVLETRDRFHGFVVFRRRQCFNDHTFTSLEVNGVLATTVTRSLRTHIDAVLKAVALWKRDNEIVKSVLSGAMTVRQAAKKHKIQPNTVSYALRKFGVPDRRKRDARIQDSLPDQPTPASADSDDRRPHPPSQDGEGGNG